MATALFIKPIDLKRNSIVDGSVDVDKFLGFIKLSQEIHIRNYLGTDLYNDLQTKIIGDTLTTADTTLINTYIQPMLIHFAMVDYLPFASYQVKNGGVFKHTSENSESVSKEELDYLIAKHRNFAEYYTRRFIDFMTFNQSTYPKYNSNTNDDIPPDKDSLFNGWQL
tara:strand:+ start:1116 stop:1616 length:501 start_codon:yes stop_codon:yes gene_type:complete